jgi:hypothetical protein
MTIRPTTLVAILTGDTRGETTMTTARIRVRDLRAGMTIIAADGARRVVESVVRVHWQGPNGVSARGRQGREVSYVGGGGFRAHHGATATVEK